MSWDTRCNIYGYKTGNTYIQCSFLFIGWCYGERLRDGECGWFPANYVVEIVNPHVRARNLRQRYRLLAFTQNYFNSK